MKRREVRDMYNILICDDQPDIVNALKIYLSMGDYRLFEAYTGREAVEVVQKQEIHLILMDIMMPEMDGIAATVKLREEYNIPVIFLTAKSELSDKVLGLNVGADDYVTKPFDPVEVQARVRSHLRRYMRLGGQLKPEPVKDVLSIGGIGCAWAWRCLGRRTPPPAPVPAPLLHDPALTDADSGQVPRP